MTTQAPAVCTCRSMTAGVCLECQLVRPPWARIEVKLDDLDPKLAYLRARLARLTREFAAGETDAVRRRLEQVADVFEKE